MQGSLESSPMRNVVRGKGIVLWGIRYSLGLMLLMLCLFDVHFRPRVLPVPPYERIIPEPRAKRIVLISCTFDHAVLVLTFFSGWSETRYCHQGL